MILFVIVLQTQIKLLKHKGKTNQWQKHISLDQNKDVIVINRIGQINSRNLIIMENRKSHFFEACTIMVKIFLRLFVSPNFLFTTSEVNHDY